MDNYETHAISNVDLSISAGEYVAVVGPSGSGKSTLLGAIGLLENIDAGTYTLDGVQVDTLDSEQRTAIRSVMFGFVFQSFHLIGDLTAYENVELALKYRDVPPRQRRERTLESLSAVGLAHRTDHRPSQLSGGQQQRIAIARAMVSDPRVLLADEPTGNLDSANAGAIMDLFESLNRRGVSICVATHDQGVRARAHRVVGLFDGVVVQA
jgi:putative ABC transport system ATP-binding protein